MACFVGRYVVGFEAMRTDSCMGRCLSQYEHTAVLLGGYGLLGLAVVLLPGVLLVRRRGWLGWFALGWALAFVVLLFAVDQLMGKAVAVPR